MMLRAGTALVPPGEKATFWRVRGFWYVDIAGTRMTPCAAPSVSALYAEHALGLVRLAVVMMGDRGMAEDIVQDAFPGLYRRWDQLPDTTVPLAYVRVSVLNGCRTALRRRSRFGLGALGDVAEGDARTQAESAEASALLSEEQRTVAAALRRLPQRQREAVVLRYYLDGYPSSRCPGPGRTTPTPTQRRGRSTTRRCPSPARNSP